MGQIQNAKNVTVKAARKQKNDDMLRRHGEHKAAAEAEAKAKADEEARVVAEKEAALDAGFRADMERLKAAQAVDDAEFARMAAEEAAEKAKALAKPVEA